MKNKVINIKNYLSTERYVTRKELVEATGLSDRKIREKIYSIYQESGTDHVRRKHESYTKNRLGRRKCYRF